MRRRIVKDYKNSYCGRSEEFYKHFPKLCYVLVSPKLEKIPYYSKSEKFKILIFCLFFLYSQKSML